MARRKLTTKRRTRTASKTRRTRKRPVKSRKTVAKPKKKIVNSSSNNAHHQVRMHAFSSATSQPKIPDGTFTSSLSRRCQNVVGIRNGDASMGDSIMYIVMGPTLGVPLLIYASEDGVSKRSVSSSDPQFVGFPGQTVGWSFNAPNNTKVYPPVNGTEYELTHNGGFSQWRIVSQALRLELTNTDDENDGWFEACRFNFDNDNGSLQFTPLDGSTTSKFLGAAPSHNGLYNQVFSMAMVEQPSYSTGLLRDLKKYEFMLHPQSTTHDPVSITPRVKFTTGSEIKLDTAATTCVLDETSLASTVIKDMMYDKNMDWLLLRLHCRKNSIDAGSAGSAFICNVIQNLEVAFNADSDFAAFQTVNKMDKRHATVTDFINNNVGSKKLKSEYNL